MRVFLKIVDWFIEKTTWLTALLWFTASQIVYMTMLLVTIPSVENQSHDMKVFDLMPMGYSFQYATTLLEQLGESGRQIYVTNLYPIQD